MHRQHCAGFEEPGSAMGPQKVSSIKWLSINMDKGEARIWDRGLWCSSVARIIKALNSMCSATRRKGGGSEKRKGNKDDSPDPGLQDK